ncbi:lactococcin 972 family bacteriocin [Mycetocola saprophilus]|uniref:lactococcin 972 family bacteriocin n=1 Tax=Mycetocola saprophilus TaxID=76636 RepID=UPI0009E03B6A
MFGKLKARRSIVAGAVCALALAIVPASQVQAVEAGGGTWDYGVRSGGIYGSGGEVFSIYNHSQKSHRATACNAQSCEKTGWHAPRATATAIKRPMSFSGNKSYWDVK